MNYFRSRILTSFPNIPQMESGEVRYKIGSYKKSPPRLQVLVVNVVVGTTNGAVNIYAVTLPTLSLNARLPGISAVATSP